MKIKSIIGVLAILLINNSSYAQTDSVKTTTKTNVIALPTKTIPTKIEPIQLSGPRVGFSAIFPGETADVLKSDLGMNPFFTQFGWQFEHQYFALDNGVSGLVEFVGLVGGLEQGKFLPSGSLLIGVRGSQGGEFAFGPNLSLTGASFVFAAGHTYQSGDLNFPVNFAVVPSTKGLRLSLLVGFNARTR